MQDCMRAGQHFSYLLILSRSGHEWLKLAGGIWEVGSIQGVDDGGVEVGWVMESQGWQDGNWRDEE